MKQILDTRFTDLAAWEFDLSQDAPFPVNRKRTHRLMRKMGLQAIYPKPRATQPDQTNNKYPYLLRALTTHRPNQVWSTDIT